MDKLPTTIIKHIYEYDNTYKIKFGKCLLQMKMHFFIFICSECFKPLTSVFVIVKLVEHI